MGAYHWGSPPGNRETEPVRQGTQGKTNKEALENIRRALMPVKFPCDLPTPPELARDPELGVLTLLEAAIHVATYALLAENMDICAHEDFVGQRQLLQSTQTVGDILDKLKDLRRNCELYRKQRQEEALAREPDDF